MYKDSLDPFKNSENVEITIKATSKSIYAPEED
jgi:hypothetical protein